MEFLTKALEITLVEDGTRYTSFAGDLRQEHPGFEHILGCRAWARKLQDGFEIAMNKTKAPLAYIGIFIDRKGAFVTATFTKRVQTGDAKKHVMTALAKLPEPQRQLVENTLRPFDELDKERVEDMVTIYACRPQGLTASREPPRPHAGPVAEPQSLAEFFAEFSSESEAEQGDEAQELELPLALQVFGANTSTTLNLQGCGSTAHAALAGAVEQRKAELLAATVCVHKFVSGMEETWRVLKCTRCGICFEQAKIYRCSSCNLDLCACCIEATRAAEVDAQEAHDAAELAIATCEMGSIGE